MTHEIFYFTLWFMVTVACIWAMRRTHRYMQASLKHIEDTAKEISQFLGTHRR